MSTSPQYSTPQSRPCPFIPQYPIYRRNRDESSLQLTQTELAMPLMPSISAWVPYHSLVTFYHSSSLAQDMVYHMQQKGSFFNLANKPNRKPCSCSVIHEASLPPLSRKLYMSRSPPTGSQIFVENLILQSQAYIEQGDGAHE